MPSSPLRQLTTVLRGCIQGGDYPRALRLLATNLPLSPHNGALRRYAAQILLETGQEENAASILELLALHYARSGQPLLALVNAHRLSHLSSGAERVFGTIASLYHCASEHLDPDSTISEPPQPLSTTHFDLRGTQPEGPLQELAQSVYRLAADTSDLQTTPGPVPPIPLLSHFPRHELLPILKDLSLRTVPEGKPVLARGSQVQEASWIASGEMRGSSEGQPSFRLLSGGLLTYRALLAANGVAPSITLEALSPVETLSLSASVLQRNALQKSYNALRDFDASCILNQACHGSPLFQSLPEDELRALRRDMEFCEILPGSPLMVPGQLPDGIYITIAGHFLQQNPDGSTQRIEAGTVLGAALAVSGSPAVARITAESKARVVFLASDHVDRICTFYPEILDALAPADA